MKTNHLSRVLLIAAVSLMVNGCYADGPSAVSASPNSSDLETAETVTICTRNVPFDIEKVNDVLEEKDYPYRLKHVQDISAEELLDPSYTCETGYMKDMEMMEEYDIFVYDFVPSYFESLYREGLLNDLDDSLRSLLPNDMYSRFGGNSYIFPSNFSYTPYMDLNPDVYYVIVKDELAEEYAIHSIEELEEFMLHRNDYTIANLTNQIFDLPGRSDFESSGWNLGVHWDNEKEIFYNPYIVERKHIELSVHLEKEVVQTNENDADIIFGVPLKEGYTGIEYQPNIMNSFCNLGLVFGKNAGTYAQQFVYDLYTDPDLSNAAPLHFTDEGIYFGNLELMTPETLQTYYGLDQFSYEDFVERIDGTKSKLFDTGLTMLDACTMEQYLELMDYGSFESVGGIGKDIEVLDEILDTQPKYLNSIIERLNKLYQQCKD